LQQLHNPTISFIQFVLLSRQPRLRISANRVADIRQPGGDFHGQRSSGFFMVNASLLTWNPTRFADIRNSVSASLGKLATTGNPGLQAIGSWARQV
jgi:hypothetical protein